MYRPFANRLFYLYTYFEFNSTRIRVGRIEFSSVQHSTVCVCVCVYHAFLSQGEWGYVLHARDYTVASNGCALFAWTVSNSFVFPPEFDKLFYRDGVRKITFRNLVWRMIIFFVSFFFFFFNFWGARLISKLEETNSHPSFRMFLSEFYFVKSYKKNVISFKVV